MKKLISVFTAVLFAAMLLFPIAAFAESEAVFTIDDAENVAPGSEFTIVVHISGDYEIHNANLTFEYDPNALEVVNTEQCDFLKTASEGNIVILDHNQLASQGRIALGIAMVIDPLKGEGDLISMTFRVKEGVTTNQQVTLYVAEFGYMPLGQLNSTPVRYTANNSIITISGATDPEEGFNDTDSGYAQGIATPVPGSSAVPTLTATPTDDPSSEDEPNRTPKPMATKAPGDDVSSTNNPGTEDGSESTGNPGTTDDPKTTGNPGTANNDKDGIQPIVYILIGVVIVVAGTAICLVAKNKKKNKNN